MYDLGSFEMGKIEVYEWVDIGMNLDNGYIISTFQNHISKNAAVKGLSWAVFCSDRGHTVSICVVQGTLGWVR